MDHFGTALRMLRTAAGLSLAELAHAMAYSKAVVGRIELGERRPAVAFARSADQVLGTAPLLVLLADYQGGSSMRRRALLEAVGLTVGAGLAIGTIDLSAVARHMLGSHAGDDWERITADFERRSVSEPTPELAQELLAHVMLLQREIKELGLNPARAKVSAELSLTLGLLTGNQGNYQSARGWYSVATMMSDRTGDPATQSWVRARAASRGVYEGYTAREALHGAGAALVASDAPTWGALEAHAARVHVYGLTGRLAEGRASVVEMRRVADAMPAGAEAAGPHERAVSFHNYLECRLGSLSDAHTAFAEAEVALRAVPLWLTDARLYAGRAMVRAGDVDTGVSFALSAVDEYPHDVRVLAVGVADLLAVVPAGRPVDGLARLRSYAANAPAPWETVV